MSKLMFHLINDVFAANDSVDSLNVICDCSGVGWANFSYQFEKELIPLGTVFTERFNKLYLFNSGMLVRAMLTCVWPIIPLRSREKIIICDVNTIH